MKHNHRQQGQILLLGIVILAVLITMSASLLGYTTLQLRAGRQSYVKAQALQVAEAGLDKALYELNLNSNFSGDTSVTLPTGTFTTSVSTIDPANKLITSTGYVPDANDPVEEVTVKTQVTINSSEVAFNFGVQVGEAGMTMANNSTVIGNVFSNGDIIGGNGSVITGDATVASGAAAAADQECTSFISGLDLNNVSNRVDGAQQFTPAVTGPLTKISAYLKKTGSPSDITVSIVTDSGNRPTKTNVGGNGAISGSAVTTSYGWIDAGFSTSPELTAGTPYWLVLNTSDTTTNYYTVGQSANTSCVAGTGGAYTNNATSGNPTWTLTNTDLNFQAFMGGDPTILDNVDIQGTLRANTIKNCSVAEDAYFQVNDACIVTGTQFAGSTDQAPQPLPISDAQIADWEDTASTGNTITGPYTVIADTFGPTIIDGDLLIEGTLYLTGPVWVKGNITLGNNASVRADISLGNNGAILLADNPADQVNSGFVDISNNAIILGNNNPGSYPMILTTKSGSAMNVKNNAVSAIYYANNGTINVSNNAGGNQVTGYGISLQENSEITYSTGLQHATFANGPGGSWVFTPGTYLIAE